MTQESGPTLERRRWLGGAMFGYILLAGSAVFLLNVVYQAIRFELFDGVAAAMIGVFAVYCSIAIVVIAAFSRGKAAKPAADVGFETAPHGTDGFDGSPGRPHLRLLTFDSSDAPASEAAEAQEIGAGQTRRAA
jgi:hypothetical protein